MPKEIVKDIAGTNFHAIVGWDKEHGHVQVATVAPDMPLVTDDSAPEHNGWHVTLDREGINRMIKVLRTARKQAFGAKE